MHHYCLGCSPKNLCPPQPLSCQHGDPSPLHLGHRASGGLIRDTWWHSLQEKGWKSFQSSTRVSTWAEQGVLLPWGVTPRPGWWGVERSQQERGGERRRETFPLFPSFPPDLGLLRMFHPKLQVILVCLTPLTPKSEWMRVEQRSSSRPFGTPPPSPLPLKLLHLFQPKLLPGCFTLPLAAWGSSDPPGTMVPPGEPAPRCRDAQTPSLQAEFGPRCSRSTGFLPPCCTSG